MVFRLLMSLLAKCFKPNISSPNRSGSLINKNTISTASQRCQDTSLALPPKKYHFKHF